MTVGFLLNDFVILFLSFRSLLLSTTIFYLFSNTFSNPRSIQHLIELKTIGEEKCFKNLTFTVTVKK